MQTFFQNNSSDELILFFNGWAMDEKPFFPIKSSRDILFISDYATLPQKEEIIPQASCDKYKKLILVSFSAGVFMAAYLQNILPKFDLKIAVNGTLTMLDEGLGVPQDVFWEMENLSLDNVLEFREKITDNEMHYNLFNQYQPCRDLPSSMEELFALKKYFTKPKFFYYDKIIIGKNDRILPAKNQLRAWGNHKNIRKTQGGHFLFYNFKDFDELVKI